jgi:predicted MPP superfamily phosphohydrolase
MRVSTSLVTLTAAAAAGLGFAWVEARSFMLRSFTLPILPNGSTPLRVLHVSDLHLVPGQQRKVNWLRSLATLEPDLVVSTGDNLGAKDAVPMVMRAYGELLHRPGVFVLGSNDYWAPQLKNPARYLLRNGGRRRIHGDRVPTSELVAGFQEAGWLDLTNRRATLKVGSNLLEFVGVDDPHLAFDRYDQVSGVLDPAADLTVGVAHAPYRRVLDAMVRDGAKLVLTGHTHGGQLCLPWFGALVTNCDLPRRRAKGVSQWSVGVSSANPANSLGPSADAPASWLHVSAGMGTSPFMPIRFACRPEASLLTLVAPEAFAP